MSSESLPAVEPRAEGSTPPANASPAQALSSLVSKARHDLRNPLSDILGYSEILQEEATERGQTELIPDLQAIHHAASNIFGQVNECLNLQKIHSRQSDLTTLQQTIHSFAEKIVTTAAELSRKCDSLGDPALNNDVRRIIGAARQLQHLAPGLIRPLFEPDHKLPAELETPTQTDTILSTVAVGEPGFSAAKPSASDSQMFVTTVPSGGTQCSDVDRSSLLVVDDNEANRALLARQLQRQGYTVSLAENGRQALEQLRALTFDLVLLDIMMPEVDGFQVLTAMKSDEALRHLPVIMISALDDLASLVRCIEKGADDYLTKPFDPVLLRARIGSCLEKKRLHDREQRAYEALAESQKHLAAELAEAASYIKSLLPPPLTGELRTELRFLPSSQLGGDAFGYHWLDPDHFAIYLLDVCGHGVGAALLSISAINVLRFHTLPATDFRDPGAVLSGLNEAFQMEHHHNMYFTLWYGVFQKSRRRLCYASAGHPPAILLTGLARESAAVEKLGTNGLIIGAIRGAAFASQQIELQPFSQLYVFSDGAYEITKKDGSMLTLSEFAAHLAGRTHQGLTDADTTLRFLEGLHGSNVYEDDLSLLELTFQ